jgi:hypothetical protein
MTQDQNKLRFFPLLEITSEAKTKRRLEKTARASKKRSTLRGIKDGRKSHAKRHPPMLL